LKKRWMIAPIASGILAIGGLAAVAYGEPGKLIPVDPATLEPVEAAEQPVASDQTSAGAIEGKTDEQKYAPVTSEEPPAQIPAAAEPVISQKTGHKPVVHAKAERPTEFRALISRDEAVRIAISQTGQSARVAEVELDEDDGRIIYEIELEGGPFEYELEIDAATGDILDFEKDD
jgi:uncharacterized membrane protein YkoI